MATYKNSTVLIPNQADIQAISHTHEMVNLTKFHDDMAKIVEFLLRANVWTVRFILV